MSAVLGPPVIGVDIGGVLVNAAFHGTDTSFFGDRPMETPSVPGSLEGLRALAELFEGRVYIVSKAMPAIAQVSVAWLRHHGVFDYVDEQNGVHFVRHKSDKAGVFEAIGATHAIDDNLHGVLTHLTTVRHRLWFTGGGAGPHNERPKPWATECKTWEQVVRRVRTTLKRDYPAKSPPR